MSIEEVLRSNTIHELRDLITTLEKDTTTKQSELQQMVGSTYHDFIQSADVIAEMQQSAASLSHELSHFWTMSLDVVSKSNALLNKQLDETPVQQLESRRSKCESASVWLHLDEGNVYEAAKIIAEANMICHNVLLNLPTLSLERPTHHNKTIYQASQTLFLKDTVIDDCYMCLSEANDAERIARCLTALCLLDSSACSMTDKYLLLAKQRLVSVFSGRDSLSNTLVEAVNCIKQSMCIYDEIVSSKLLSRLMLEALRELLGTTAYKCHDKAVQQYADKLQPEMTSWNSFITEAVQIVQMNLHNELAKLSTPHEIQLLRKTLHASCCDASLPLRLVNSDKQDALWVLIFQEPFTTQVENMLKSSFLDAFGQIKGKIDSAVQASGVSLQGDLIITQDLSSYSSSAVISQRARIVWEIVVAHLRRLAYDEEVNDKTVKDTSDEALEVCMQEQVCILFGRVLTYIRLFLTVLAKHEYNTIPVINSVLMLCRIAWVIRSNCLSFLPSKPAPRPKGSTVPVEQMLSAFDIADTNGDGLISYDEAVEALDAIQVNAASAPDLRLGGVVVETSYSSYELRLLATEIIERNINCESDDDIDVLRSWNRCIEHCCEDIVNTALAKYRTFLKGRYTNLSNSFRIASYLWKRQVVDGSTVYVPSVLSEGIHEILSEVHKSWASQHVSVDTVVAKGSTKSLADQYMDCMIGAASEIITAISPDTTNDDAMLQLLFDLKVCASLTKSHTFDVKIKLIESKIDLVTMQLAGPLLQDSIANYISQTHLLIPVLGSVPTVAKTEPFDVKCLFAESSSKQKFAMLPLPMHTPNITTARIPAKLTKQVSSSSENYGIGKVFSGISENLGGFLG